jgi:hypothetical protein
VSAADTLSPPLSEADLDRWLPQPALRVQHSRRAAVPAAELWQAANEVRLKQTPTLGRLVQWRLPGTELEQTFRSLLASDPFTVLAEGEGYSLSGLCGRIWTLSRDYAELDGPEDFRDWDRPGTVRVLFADWVEPDGDGARLISQARVGATDGRAKLAFRSLWLVVGVFERLIGAEVLEAAVHQAEAKHNKL